MRLTAHQLDRAAGAIVGSAAGDALGSQYEFGPSHTDDFVPQFGWGVFGHEPGEWTDDTAMAIPILRVIAGDLPADCSPELAIVREWIGWSKTAKDVGAQTRAVLGRIERRLAASGGWFAGAIPAEEAKRHHEQHGRSGGNGSLMRTGPVGLLGLADAARRDLEAPDAALVARVAGLVAQLTHWEDDNVDACVLWSLAIQHAVLTGELDVARGLEWVPAGERRERWAALIDEAQAPDSHPRDFAAKNGWVVAAFQAALAAVHDADDYPEAVSRAIRGGGDTDTVAAIAGALAGARWGSTQVPLSWQRRLHGWPGLTANDLTRLAVLAARGGASDGQGWPTAGTVLDPNLLHTDPVPHPFDDGVWLGSQSALRMLPDSVGAVVSLARVGVAEVPDAVESIRVWLVDQPGKNLNLDRTLTDAADVIAHLRAEGKEVFVHCAEARSRTSAVAALYAVRHCGVGLEEAWTGVRHVLPHFAPAEFLRDAVARIAADTDSTGLPALTSTP